MQPDMSTMVFVAGSGLVSGLGCKIVYDWLNRRGDVPRARNGFLTSSEILAHCANQQKMLRELIEGGFQIVATELRSHLIQVDERLNRGDNNFDKIEAELRSVVDELKTINRGGNYTDRNDKA